jgi:RecB family exonuclease
VRGRVDRIDTTPDGTGLFVYDYKSGAAPTAKAIGTAEGLQLPLYLLALGIDNPETQVLGGAYVSLKKGEVSGVIQAGQEALLGKRAGKCLPVDEQAREQLADGVLAIAQEMTLGIHQGIITPQSKGECPVWCDLGPVCRSKRGARHP